MRARSMAALLGCGLSLALATPASAGDLPTAEEIFKKHTAAIGGDALTGVKNAAMEFTFSMPAMGVETTGEFHVEAPDKSHTLINLMAMGSADFEDGVNGEVAWQDNPQMGLRALDGIERTMALQKTRLDAFAGWEERWERAETVGEETVGETPCYKVLLTPSGGGTVTAYFDKETGLVVQQEIPVPQMGATVTVKLSDYREVDGITLAHRIDQEGPMPAVVEYTSVRFNVDDIPDGIFELPAGIQEMAVR